MSQNPMEEQGLTFAELACKLRSGANEAGVTDSTVEELLCLAQHCESYKQLPKSMKPAIVVMYMLLEQEEAGRRCRNAVRLPTATNYVKLADLWVNDPVALNEMEVEELVQLQFPGMANTFSTWFKVLRRRWTEGTGKKCRFRPVLSKSEPDLCQDGIDMLTAIVNLIQGGGVSHVEQAADVAKNIFDRNRLLLVYKKTTETSEIQGIKEGLGECISRVYEAMTNQHKETCMMPIAVLDNNKHILPAIVVHSKCSSNHKLYRISTVLRFADKAGKHADVDSPGFKLELQARAEDQELCFAEGEVVSVVSDSMQTQQYTILRCLKDPSCSGCVYEARAPGNQHVVLKVGPPPSCIDDAARLGLPTEPWMQAQNELETLKALGQHGQTSLPVLVGYGVIEPTTASSSRACLANATVVVTSPCGQCLLPPDGRVQPMPASDVEQLMWHLLDGLAVLQARGILHCDMHLRNMAETTSTQQGSSSSSSSGSRSKTFLLFDFGSAIDQHKTADAAAFERAMPLDLYTSATELVYGMLPTPLADVQSLFFNAMVLVAGSLQGLPWYKAAAAGDARLCVQQRDDFMKNPRGWASWGLFSPALQQLMTEVFNNVLAGDAESYSLAAAIKRLHNQ